MKIPVIINMLTDYDKYGILSHIHSQNILV